MAVIFLLVTVTLAYTVQTAVTDPGKDLRFPVVKKSSRDLLRLQNSLLLWIPVPLLGSIIPSWEEPARAQLLKADPSQLQHGVSLR